jgi:hypothetical protein
MTAPGNPSSFPWKVLLTTTCLLLPFTTGLLLGLLGRVRHSILPLLVSELHRGALPLSCPGALLVVEDPLFEGRVLGLRGRRLIQFVRLLGMEAAALVLGGSEVVDRVGVGPLWLAVADDVEAGGVGGVTEAVEGVVLLVEEEGQHRGVLHVSKFVVAVAGGGGDGDVRVLRADDGRPKLVSGGVKGDEAERGVQRAGGGGGGGEREHGVVDGGGGRLRGEAERG